MADLGCEGGGPVIVVGADVHKRCHTFVAIDEAGRKLGEKVVA
jgi:transposase